MMPARLTEYDFAHLGDILDGQGDWFSAQLIRLISKSDFENKARLRLAFPDHVRAYEEWERGVTLRQRIEMTDPLVGTCARCEKLWSEHPGGFCPDAVGADGMVAVNDDRQFVPKEDA